LTALIRRNDAALSVTWTEEAARLRDEALDLASLIGIVSTPEQQEAAVQAQIAIKTVLKDCEDARVACKQPVLEFGRTIDAQAKAFTVPLNKELERVSAQVRDYVAVQEQQRRAQEALQLAELEAIERKRQEELAKANTIEEIDKIQHRINDEVKDASVPLVVVRAEGQVVREDWEITVTDIWALAKAHPNCVQMEVRRSEVKTLLNAGVRPPGIEAKRVQNSGVRVGRRAEPLRIALAFLLALLSVAATNQTYTVKCKEIGLTLTNVVSVGPCPQSLDGTCQLVRYCDYGGTNDFHAWLVPLVVSTNKASK
jgi:hypothetical protein